MLFLEGDSTFSSHPLVILNDVLSPYDPLQDQKTNFKQILKLSKFE